MPASEPFVLVKKKDGTTERLPLSAVMSTKEETSAATKKVTPPTPAPVVPEEKPSSAKATEVKLESEAKPADLSAEAKKVKVKAKNEGEKKEEPKNLPVPEKTTHALAKTTPVKEIFLDEAKAASVAIIKKPSATPNDIATKPVKNNPPSKKVSTASLPKTDPLPAPKIEIKDPGQEKPAEENFQSPLEESVEFEEHIKKTGFSALPQKENLIFEKVLKEISFPISRGLYSRLESLLTSFSKEIRTRDQVKEYLLRPENSGGMGFSEDQAEELLAIIENKVKNKKTEPPNQKTKMGNLPQMGIPSKPVTSPQPTPHRSTPSASMSDVVPPQKIKRMTTGPIDEFKSFDLVELRRLGDPATAKEIILQKFDTLKEESYLLYLDGVAAWKLSPIYTNYKDLISQAVAEKKNIQEIINQRGKDSLSSEEFAVMSDISRKVII